MSILVPTFGQLNKTKHALASLVLNLDKPKWTELIVLCQGDDSSYANWVDRFLRPHLGWCNIICTRENQGLPKAHNLLAGRARSDVLAYMHNDVLVYEHAWDDRLLMAFDVADDRGKPPGVVGFVGARCIDLHGSRGEVWSNMLEAELHGSRGYGMLPVALLDGMVLAMRRDMLATVGGWDEEYPMHHYYDYDISLAAIAHGFHNLMVGVECHHLNGQTANSSQFSALADRVMGAPANTGQTQMHSQARHRYLHKWGSRFPMHVDDWLNGEG